MTITTRTAVNGDRDFLWRLKVASMREFVEQVYGWDDAVQRNFFDDGFHPEELIIIQFEGKDVGMYELEDCEDHYFLSRIEILPEFQGRGIGSTIMEKIIKEVRPTGKPLRLQLFKVNPAQRVYVRLGFVKIAETATHFQMELSNH